MTPIVLTPTDMRAQSLGTGSVGLALVAVEDAFRSGTWTDAHRQLSAIAAAPIDASPQASLFHGAPAVAFLLHAANADGHSRAPRALSLLDTQVHRLTWQRLADARARIRAGAAATFREYDLFYGLTGLGALLLHRFPGSDTLANILTYVTDLAEPSTRDLPGWWVGHDPDPRAPTPGGHANLGLAHGAASLLALLATALRRGVETPGQREAIENLHVWFDHWRQPGPDGPWWPEWVTRAELDAGHVDPRRRPGRPSWCYGAIGIARAQQLAAIATGDHHRQADAEATVTACLTPTHVARLAGPGLCHGIAGLYQTAFRAATDERGTAISDALPIVADALRRQADNQIDDPWLLDGQAGLHLALTTLRTGTAPISGWDTCLLI